MEPWQIILFGVAAASLGYSMLQGSKIRHRLRRQDSYGDVLDDVRSLESSAQGVLQKLEVRAYDYGREVESRIENRLAVLDQLILDADREIDRLQMLLAESQKSPGFSPRVLTPDDQQRCFALKEAGCSTEEIARCLQTTPEKVDLALGEWERTDRRAA